MKKLVLLIITVVICTFTARAQYINGDAPKPETVQEAPEYQKAIQEINNGETLFVAGITCAAIGCTAIYVAQNLVTFPENRTSREIVVAGGAVVAITGMILNAVGEAKIRNGYATLCELKFYGNGLLLVF